MTVYGYARVSTRGQDTALQEEALRSAGCDRIHHEKVSGAKSDNRPQLCRLLRLVTAGDIVVVTRLDRLARSTRDLLNIVHTIGEAGATFKSLAEPWADTTSDHGKLIFTILGGLAEFERSLIRSRTESGIAKARELGVQFGRPARLNPRQKRMVADAHASGESMANIAERFEVGVATVWRALRSEPA
jgi:DNA invertase Pin-like site-specific DNA recombinase